MLFSIQKTIGGTTDVGTNIVKNDHQAERRTEIDV